MKQVILRSSKSKLLVIGVTGGSGSGKTTFADLLFQRLGSGKAAIIHVDAYYKELEPASLQSNPLQNFDDPDALDWQLLTTHLKQLKSNQIVQIPVYDFKTHRRLPETTILQVKPLIIVEGLLFYQMPQVAALLDLKIFLDVAADLRFIRRLERDTRERGRTVSSVIGQYLQTVRPMHLAYMEPAKNHADIIVNSSQKDLTSDLETILQQIKALS